MTMTSTSISNGEDEPYILYHNIWSICSIMVRYTVAVKGAPSNSADAMMIQEQGVDIYNNAQLEEQFLLEVNPKGQVPVLANAAVLATPIADSLEITWYIADRYPSLAPAEHKEDINRLLRDLHALNYFSLSFEGKPHVPASGRAAVVQLMENPEISQRYRDALAYKLTIVEKEKVGGIVPTEVQKNKEKSRKLLLELETLLVPADGPWLYGATVPTALDAHLVTFIARLVDLGKEALVPQALIRYSDKAKETPEWRGVMNGRRTMFGS